MKRTLVVLSIVALLAGCNDRKKDDCIDPTTFVNRCVEQQSEQDPNAVPTSTGQAYNSYPNDTVNHYTTYREHETVVVREKPKPSIIPPAVGGMVGAWLGKKWADRKAAQTQTVSPTPDPIPPQAPRTPVRQVPIVPDSKPYVPPPRPSYTPPRPTYTAPARPSYSPPPSRPSVPSSRR